MSVTHARTGTKYNILPFVRETNFYKNHIKRIILKSRPECRSIPKIILKHATLYLSQIMSILSISVHDVRNVEQIRIFDITRFTETSYRGFVSTITLLH